LPDQGPAGGPESPDAGEEQAQSELEAKPASLEQALEPAPESGATEAFHQRARLAEDRLAEVLGAYRAMRAENEGYRERVSKNVERRYEQRRERLLLKFMEILDNLDRALDAAEQSYAGNPLIEGLILVRTQLLQTLQEEGLERMPALGLPYDPSHSEAVQTQPVGDPDHHHVVVKELLRGYRLNGRVVRPSRVVVGEYAGAGQQLEEKQPEPAAAAPPEPEPSAESDDSEAGGPSLEEIISRAEAHEALFPDVFGTDEKAGTK
jgi:molecular chaperone GrpE